MQARRTLGVLYILFLSTLLLCLSQSAKIQALAIATPPAPTSTPASSPLQSPEGEISWWLVGLAGLLFGGILVWILRPLFEKSGQRVADWLINLGSGWGFRQRYLTHLIEEYRGLNIRGFRTKAPFTMELEQAYVPLHLQVADIALGQQSSSLNISQAMTQHKRLAILSASSMGRTTLLAYLTLTYARGQAHKRLGLREKRLPILIPLRRLATAQSSEKGLDTLPAYLTEWYTKLGLRPRTGFFEKVLRDGRCLVLFDGLDEVADETERRRMSEWVDWLVTIYPNNRYIVSSRTLGYGGAPLENGFTVLRVCDFTDDAIRQFATNWCLAVELAAQGEDNPTARRRARDAARDLVGAIEANLAIRKLAANPLLLSIIALVHRYRASLPRRRVDLYAECVDVLLGHWDEAKGLGGRLSPGQKRAVLQPLALEMHAAKQREISRDELEARIAALLPAVGGEADAAGDFLDEVRERSGLLVEVWVDTYAFSHLTFQEYLAAREVVEDGALRPMLLNQAGDEWWQEVVLLYAGMTDATSLVEALLATEDDTGNTLLLAGRCIAEAVRVEERVIKKVVHKLEDAFATSTGRSFLETGQVLAEIAGEDSVDFFLRLSRDDPDRREAAQQSLVQMSRQFNEAMSERVLQRLTERLQDPGVREEAFAVLISVWGIYKVMSELHTRLSLSDLDQTVITLAEMMDPMTAVIPSGEFLMGDERRRVQTDAFRIDRHPVTNAQYKRFVEATGHHPPSHWKDGNYPYEELLHPVVQISWYDAIAYAEWAGKRLPTEEEWEKAARGTDGRLYPWGNQEPTPDLCNFAGNEKGTTPVGRYSPQGDSPYTCTDMAGNVWEWCLSSVAVYLRRRGPEDESKRVIRGGSWETGSSTIRCPSRGLTNPYSTGNDIGFRLVSDARRINQETAARITEQMRAFFDQAGFALEPAIDYLAYRCEPPTALKQILHSLSYIWILLNEELNAEQARIIHARMRGLDSKVKVVLVITDRRPTGEGWAQIGTLRMEGFTLLPIESSLLNEGLATGRERVLLRAEIEKRLGAGYDPYDVRDPVAGTFSFFGHDALLESLLRRLIEGRPMAVFGLRKMGKSSLLQALHRQSPFPTALVNLQTVGHAALDELFVRILRHWTQWIQNKTDIDLSLPSIVSRDPTGSFVAAALKLLEFLEENQHRAQLGLFLDEVELIVPSPDGSGPSLERYLAFLRAVRGGLIDEDGRLSLIVTSLNPSITRINAWNGEQNPAFNLFQEEYLPPLARRDCIQMVRNIGQQVGLLYDDDSVEEIIALSGGHPFLARQLCSLLYKQRDRQPGEIGVVDIPGAVERFIFDEQTVTHLDAGIWQDAGNVALWGEDQAQVNQALLLELARAEDPVPSSSLLEGSESDPRRTALVNLERFHFVHQPESGVYALRYGLLRTWLRRRVLGLE